MSTSTHASFQENDIHLLQTGDFADGVVKCNGRTWNVHRMLLASRLRFFKAAFYGQFAEANSREIDFPESDPDLVDIMIRHLYRADIDIRDLKTPALCVRCWRLADYVQLESLKAVAVSSLGQHLDAMALLATSNDFEARLTDIPEWLSDFLDALREVCHDDATKPLHAIFATFLWVTRFTLLLVPELLEEVEQCHGVNRILMRLLVFGTLGIDDADNDDWPDWVGPASWRWDIEERGAFNYCPSKTCHECERFIARDETEFYNPFPLAGYSIGRVKWCERCVDKFNEDRCWPWRSGGGLEAWSWSDDE